MRTIKPPHFEAHFGDASTTTPWRRPTFQKFAKWWDSFEKVKGLDEYQIYLVGGFAEQQYGVSELAPKDIDIVLMNEIKDFEALKYILLSGVKIGWENQLMIDITWQNRLHDFDNWEPLHKIRPGKTFTRILGEQAHVHEYRADEEHLLEHGLWLMSHWEPPSHWFKAMTRTDNGDYIGIQMDVRKIFEK